jgi:ubiquitin carboxyl-terminal hydrolase L5
MRPVLQERMMRYETERLSFSLLALCGDNLDPRRKKLAINIRHLADLEARFSNSPEWHSKPANHHIICTPTNGRLSAYQLDADDIQAAPEPQIPCDTTAETALKLWAELGAEQQRLCAQYQAELQMSGQEPTAILGRTKDYTAAVHEWVKKLADRGALRRLHEDVQLQSGL